MPGGDARPAGGSPGRAARSPLARRCWAVRSGCYDVAWPRGVDKDYSVSRRLCHRGHVAYISTRLLLVLVEPEVQNGGSAWTNLTSFSLNVVDIVGGPTGRCPPGGSGVGSGRLGSAQTAAAASDQRHSYFLCQASYSYMLYSYHT
eukprot:scaffold253729_cov25-Prasinocladus_malaysianus.AAC.1